MGRGGHVAGHRCHASGRAGPVLPCTSSGLKVWGGEVGGKRSKKGCRKLGAGREGENTRAWGDWKFPVIAAPRGQANSKVPLSSAPSPIEGSLSENNGNGILLPLPPGRAGPTSSLPHRKQCFLVLTVGYPQVRMALGAPQGCRALWLRADDNWG